MEKNKLIEKKGIAYEISEECLDYVVGNRMVTPKHVADIKKAMLAGDFIPPVVADRKTLKIIDGQHRYEAFRECLHAGIEMKLSVILMDFDNPLLAAIRCNNSQKKWNVQDYVNAYVISGIEDYKRYSQFLATHTELGYNAAAQLLTGLDKPRVNCGKLKVNEENVKKADTLYKELVQMVQATGDTAILSRRVVLAWSKNREFILSKTKTFEKWISLLSKNYRKPELEGKVYYTNMYLSLVS